MSISIILTTHNDGEFLITAIPSCLRQDIDKEIILVDDCSTKPLPTEVVQMIRDNKIKVIRHERNQGLSAARNTGISEARNEWVVPLDADDWFHPCALRTLYENKDRADVVTGNCTDNGVYVPGIARGDLSKEKFISENPLICSSLFTKDIWRRAGGYMVRKGPHYEDWNFWAKCFAAGARFKYIDVSVYNHTSREDSMLRVLHPNREFYVRLATEGVFD